MKKFLICTAIALALSSCGTQRFDVEGHRVIEPSYKDTSHFVFWGIGQEKTYNPNEICGSRGISAVDADATFADGLLTVLTLGIYSPKSYSIYCKKGYF